MTQIQDLRNKRAVLAPPEMLEGKRCPHSGRPLPEPPAPTELPFAARARGQRDQAAFESWVSMSCQRRTQVICQLRYPKKEGDRLFRCNLTMKSPRTDAPLDTSAWPELLIYARDEVEGQHRFLSLLGVTHIGSHVSIVLVETTEEEARTE